MSSASCIRVQSVRCTRYSITATAPSCATCASSPRCLVPRAVTLSGNSANPGCRDRVTLLTSTKHRFRPAGQQEIDPAVFAVFLFGLYGVIGWQAGHLRRLQPCAQHTVGQAGINPGEMAVFMIHQPPAEFQLLPRVVIGFQPDPRAGVGQPHHRARVGAMGGDLAPVLQHRVGQKAFVPPQKTRGDQRGLKAHAHCLYRGPTQLKDARHAQPHRRDACHR